MARIPVENTGKNIMYCGTEMIPPGETRHIEEFHVPLHLRPAPVVAEVKEEPKDELQDLFAKTAKEVIAAIPVLSTEDLKRLQDLENARMAKDKPAVRTTVLEAIQADVLRRAEELSQRHGDGSQE